MLERPPKQGSPETIAEQNRAHAEEMRVYDDKRRQALKALDPEKSIVEQVVAIAKETDAGEAAYWHILVRIEDSAMVEKAFADQVKLFEADPKAAGLGKDETPEMAVVASLCSMIVRREVSPSAAWVEFLKTKYPDVVKNYSYQDSGSGRGEEKLSEMRGF